MVPTQLIFVPMLFRASFGNGSAGSRGRPILLGSAGRSTRAADSTSGASSCGSWTRWHAVGPALVLGCSPASPQPDLRQWPVYRRRTRGPVRARLRQHGDPCSGPPSACRPRLQLRTMGSVYVIDAGLAPVGLAVAFASASSPAGVRARAAADRRCSPSSRASGGYASTTSSSCATPTAGPRSSSATSSRPTTRTRANTAKDVVDLTLAVVDELGLFGSASGATQSSPLCSTTSARSGSRTRSSTSPGKLDAGGADDHRSSTRSRASRCCSGSAACSAEIGRHRPCLSRALGRRRLSRRHRRRADSAHRADRRLLRRVQRDDERPLVPKSVACRKSDRRAATGEREPVRSPCRRRLARVDQPPQSCRCTDRFSRSSAR